ncbi:MAG: sulfite exporter TauE/SafE family protein [Desulfobacteraceae bacterium]|jgi:sulfite exporter TauE/SafE
MSSTSPLFIILLATGFAVGFGHCIGMCGPIVVSFSLSLKGKRILISQLLYNGGRITTYTILGGLMGLTGSVATFASHISAFQRGVIILAGILIIIMALSMSGWIPMGRIFGDYYNPQGFVSRGFKRLSGKKSSFVYYPVGLLLGLLPCGPVYAALLAAAGAGMEATHSVQGILVGAGLMFGFGIGTLPSLLIVGKLAGSNWLKSKKIIYEIGAVLLIVVGIYFIIKGIRY